jgi:bifunctional DNA-binding transcriptional regulator/antitoxin component of YhaV-PrlF toxin-antitoxin module
MSQTVIQPGGEIALPAEVRRRYGMEPNTPVRIIPTRSGILIIPLTDEPMDPALQAELSEWQQLGAQALNDFPDEASAS